MNRVIIHLTALLSVLLMLSAVCPASAKPVYTITYDPSFEAEEGVEMAGYLKKMLSEKAGIESVVVAEPAGKVRGSVIRITHSDGKGIFEYSLSGKKSALTLDGGSCWAMKHAADLLVADLASKKAPGRYKLAGSIEGLEIFDRPERCDLRILDDNIWQYDSESIPDNWNAIGEDCRDDYRAPQFAQIVRAYMPDVVTLQEYSRHMHQRFNPLVERYGYAITSVGEGKAWYHTPIFYKTSALELLETNFCLYTPEKWSNKGTKSFTSAVFKRKIDGKQFAVITTHLWWKGDSAQPGSSQARASQIRLVIAEAECIKAKYGCPVFVTGDMNCYEDSTPLQQFISEGFKPCYELATLSTDNTNGHHICSAKDGYSRQSRRRSPLRKEGAIDHCFLYNGQSTEVLVFDCITPFFTIKLTDHYPNLIDARL